MEEYSKRYRYVSMLRGRAFIYSFIFISLYSGFITVDEFRNLIN